MDPNYVYVMRLNDRAHKIGISVDPGCRSLQLSYLHRQPVRVVYTWLREAGDAQEVESTAHRILSDFRSEDFFGDEIFDVTADAACCAVELALALHRDAVTEINKGLPIKINSLLADMSALPINHQCFGYIDPAIEDKTPYVLEMRRKGVEIDRVYTDWRACVKAIRSGDTLLIQSADKIDTSRLAERNINVRAI